MAIFSIIFLMLVIWLCMWIFFKFMYPKPPKAFMPQPGDIVTPRNCDYCGYPLATYRGIVELKPSSIAQSAENNSHDNPAKQSQSSIDANKASTLGNNKESSTLTRRERKQQMLQLEQQQKEIDKQEWAKELETTWFFCNEEHQADFHAGKQDTRNKTS